MKEVEEIQKERVKALSYAHLLRVGQYLKRKPLTYNSLNERHYSKILHVSDSGHGYSLVIAESFNIKDMKIFHDGAKDIIVPDQDVFMTVSQWYHADSSLEYYEPITEEEYQKARAEVLQHLTTTNVPATREIIPSGIPPVQNT